MMESLSAALIESVLPFPEEEVEVVATVETEVAVDIEKPVAEENVVETEVVGDGGAAG